MSLLIPLLLAFTTPQVPDHSPLHPPEAAFFIQATDLSAFVGAYQESEWADAISDPEVQKGVAHLLDTKVEDLPVAIEAIKAKIATDLDLTLWMGHLSELRAMSLSICVLDANPLRAAIEGSEFPGSIGKLFKAQLIAEFTTAESASSALADAMKAQAWKEAPFCTIEESRLVLHIGDLPTSDKPGPPMQERWGALGAELGEPIGATLMQAYSTLGDIPLQVLEGYIGYSGVDGPIGQAMTSVLGAPLVAATRGGAWRVDAKDGEFYTSGRYPHRTKSDVDEVFGTIPLTGEDLSFIHPDARVGGAISIDHDALLPWARSLVAFSGQLENPEQFEQLYGFDPVRDLVAPLGGSIHWSLQGNLSVGVPPCQLSARVTDEAAMQRGIEGFARWAEAALPGIIEAKTKKYKKVALTTFRYIGEIQAFDNAPLDPRVLIRPTISVFDGRVLLAPSLPLAKREIKRVRKGEEGQSILPSALARNPKHVQAGSIAFGDWMTLLGKVANMAKAAAVMAAPEGLPFDLNRLPDPDLFTRHFDPSIEIRTRTEHCVHYESRSCVGPESTAGLLVGLGLVANLVVPQIMGSFEASKIAKCKADLSALNAGIMHFTMNNGGNYPNSLERLVENDENGMRYLAQTVVPKDSWGSTFRYNPDPSEDAPRLWSCGPDGLDNQGQGDDITLDAVLQGK